MPPTSARPGGDARVRTQLYDISVPERAFQVSAIDFTDNGYILGTWEDIAGGESRYYLWHNDTFTEISMPEEEGVEVRYEAVNGQGIVVGSICPLNSNGVRDNPCRTLRWSVSEGIVDLGYPVGGQFCGMEYNPGTSNLYSAVAINAHGHVLGEVNSAHYETYGVLWAGAGFPAQYRYDNRGDGHITMLDVNDSGQAVGRWEDWLDGVPQVPVLWSGGPGPGQELSSFAFDINNAGDIAAQPPPHCGYNPNAGRLGDDHGYLATAQIGPTGGKQRRVLLWNPEQVELGECPPQHATSMSVSATVVDVGEVFTLAIPIENTGETPFWNVQPQGELTITPAEGSFSDQITVVTAPDPISWLEIGAAGELVYTLQAEEPGTYAFSLTIEAEGPQGVLALAVTCEVGDAECMDTVVVTAPGLVVNATGDEGDEDAGDGICNTGGTIDRDGTPEAACTLRAALEEANAHDGTDAVLFDMPGTAPFVISPATALPTISDAVTLDATTQPGYEGVPLVYLDGAATGPGVAGLHLTASSSLIKGLAVYGFGGHGLFIEGGSSNRIESCIVGTNAEGAEGIGNDDDGIRVSGGASGITVGGGTEAEQVTVAGNGGDGIVLHDANAAAAKSGAVSGFFSSVIKHVSVGMAKTVGDVLKPLPNLLSNIRLEDASDVTIENTSIGASGKYGIEMLGELTQRIKILETGIGKPFNQEPVLVGGPLGALLSGIFIEGASEVEIGAPNRPVEVVGSGEWAVLMQQAKLVHMNQLYAGVMAQYQSMNAQMRDVMRNLSGGIKAHDSDEITVEDATVANSGSAGSDAGRGSGFYGSLTRIVRITGSRFGIDPAGLDAELNNRVGLYFANSIDVSVLGNIVKNNATGIFGSNSTLEIEGNTIEGQTGTNSGIHLEGGTGTITGNTVALDAGDGLTLADGAAPLVRFNNIYSNDGFGLTNTDATVVVAAPENWWGDASGPGGAGPGTGDEVSAGVDFAGWLQQPFGILITPEEPLLAPTAGQPITTQVAFRNLLLADDDLDVTLTDTHGWLTGSTSFPVTLTDGEGAAAGIDFTMPSGADVVNVVTIQAVSQADPSLTGEAMLFIGPAEAVGQLATGAVAGSQVLQIIDQSPFAVGDEVVINPGGANQETHTIDGFGSLLLADPLQFDHAADEAVVPLSQAAPTAYDLRFLMQGDGTQFHVTVQIKTNTGTDDLGTSTLVFTYNDDALTPVSGMSSGTLADGTDVIYVNFDDDADSDYGAATATATALSGPDRLALEIVLNQPDNGTVVPSTFIDVATLVFTVDDPEATANLVWDAANTLVRDADNTTLWGLGTWEDATTTPLPVELVAFEAAVDGEAVVLTWQTASETNNAGFEVQRASKNEAPAAPEGWEVVGFVEGHGTTEQARHYRFEDAALPFGAARLRYRLKQIDYDGTFAYSPEVEVTPSGPDAFVLHSNYPNPFNPQTVIRYELPVTQRVRLVVYDALGREVAVLVDEVRPAGQHDVVFEAGTLPSGLYAYHLWAGAQARSRTMLLVK